MVMGVDSRSKGRGFESRRRILDGHDIFHIHLLCIVCFMKLSILAVKVCASFK